MTEFQQKYDTEYIEYGWEARQLRRWLPAVARRRARWCGTWYALGQDSAARADGRLCLLPPLDLLDADFAFDELVYVRHHDWPLDIHEREARYGIAEGRSETRMNDRARRRTL